MRDAGLSIAQACRGSHPFTMHIVGFTRQQFELPFKNRKQFVSLAFVEGYYHSDLVLEGLICKLNFMLSIFPLVFLMNWLYFRTGRNILVPIVIHTAANFFNEIFATHPDSKVIQTGLLLIVCIVVIVKERDLFFKREGSIS